MSSPMSSPVIVEDHPERSRYEATIDGQMVAFAEYQVRGDLVVMPHTVTLAAHRGNGYAALVVRRALDDIRAAGRRVVPSCWYVAQYIDEHPDDADLVA